MQSANHKQHLINRKSHNTCSECSADIERRFAVSHPFTYTHVHEYLAYVRPRLQAIRAGNAGVNARIWYRDFLKAMHRRISSRTTLPMTRKRSDSYLERLRGMRYVQDADYLRQFACRGASCLDS